MPLMRQSYLGSSVKGELCLSKLPPPSQLRPRPRDEILGPCWISVLPDELLSEIFSYIDPQMSCGLPKEEEKFPLTLVCKKWRRIYEPIFFHTIHANWYLTNTRLSCIRSLLSALQSRPYLAAYPRTMFMSLGTPQPGSCRLLTSIVERCTAVRSVLLRVDYANEIRDLLKAIKSLPLLEYLALFGSSSGPSIQLLFGHFLLPSLKTLQLSRYGVGKSDEDITAPWPGEPVSNTSSGLERLLPPSLYHSGNVTSLQFSDPSTTPAVTEHILYWPARLVDLSITNLTHSTSWKYYTTGAIQRLLDIHRSSLKQITLGRINGGDTGMPDFSAFPCLEELKMSPYNIIKSETGSVAVKKLLAPKLRCLSVDFSPEDQHNESRHDFGPDQVLWMQDFAVAWKKLSPPSKLERFIVAFNPSVNPSVNPYYLRRERPYLSLHRLWGSADGPTAERPFPSWPWEHVEQAKEIVAEHGLALEYESKWTEEEWNRIVREEKEINSDYLDNLWSGFDELPVEDE